MKRGTERAALELPQLAEAPSWGGWLAQRALAATGLALGAALLLGLFVAGTVESERTVTGAGVVETAEGRPKAVLRLPLERASEVAPGQTVELSPAGGVGGRSAPWPARVESCTETSAALLVEAVFEPAADNSAVLPPGTPVQGRILVGRRRVAEVLFGGLRRLLPEPRRE